jgi:sigma-B regulation protein RsbU (phosphoserine phosphatase)
MLKNRGLAFKLVLFFTISSVCIFALVFGYNYYVSRSTIAKGVEEKANSLILSTTNKIETLLNSVQKIPENLAYALENGNYDENKLLQALYAIVERNPEIYGIAVAFEPFTFKKGAEFFAPYFYRVDGSVHFKYLDRSYNYFYSDWYQIPKELERPEWTEPYYGEGGGDIMSSYGVPFYVKINNEKRFAGVVVIDISLETLRDMVSSIKIFKTGYGFILSKNGTFVTHPLKEFIMNETIFSVAEARGDRFLRDYSQKMIKGESTLMPYKIKSSVTQKQSWMAHIPIKSNGWTLAIIFPEDELMEDITNLNRVVIILGITGIFLLSFAVVYIARSITRPLKELALITEDIGKGNLDVEIPSAGSGDEVGRLSEAFRYMKTSLKEYIAQLTVATALRERMESELKVAHSIQMSILQKIFPPFPDRKEFDVYATIEPAREVGGDFYDFFQIDNEHLCFVIADVSGKGIPAALFMAVTKTLIKSKATVGLTPDRIIAMVNKELCVGNNENMFVTIFCGILHTVTGEVLYTNGGHNPPLIMKKDGDIEWLDGEGSLMVGIIDDASYITEKLLLEPGDCLFLYTDGVTEAMNDKNELFSDSRLKDELHKLHGKPIQEIIGGVQQEIHHFAEGVPQSDDITMMIIEYYKGQGDR